LVAYKNTWSNQRRKKRRKQFENEDDQTNNLVNEEKIIEFSFQVKKLNENYLVEFNSNEISLSKVRESINQIIQYIKNQFLELSK
jgi:hypothetical protein